MTTNTVAAIVAAIYLIEGGPKASKPYGILSIPVRDKAHAERICTNTVKNNHKRWLVAGRQGCYYEFLADRYCPASHDPQGNKNWKRNIKSKLGHKCGPSRKCEP